MTRKMRWAVLGVAVVLLTPVATAQSPRDGTVAGVGVGYGSFQCPSSFSCGSPAGAGPRAVGFSARVGKASSPHLVQGLEGGAWLNTRGERRNLMAALLGAVSVYPGTASGFHVKGGLGLSYSSASGVIEGDINVHDRRLGGAAMLGAAFDLRLARGMYLTPGLTLIGTSAFGEFLDKTYGMWQASVGVTWF